MAMKLSAILFLALFALSCKEKKDDPKEGPNTINIENVEGNTPDSTNSITIDRPVDTTKKDSVR